MSTDIRPHDEVCDGEVDEPYEVPFPGEWISTGYRCGKCGWQSVTVGTYIPLEKPCPDCGKLFEGMPDVPDEVCHACFSQNLADWILELKLGQS